MSPLESVTIDERALLLEKLSSNGRLFLDVLKGIREKGGGGLEDLLKQFDGDIGKGFASLDIVASHTFFEYVAQIKGETETSFTIKTPEFTFKLPPSLKMLYLLEYLEADAGKRTLVVDRPDIVKVAQYLLESAMEDRRNITKMNGCILAFIGAVLKQELREKDEHTSLLYKNDHMVQNAIDEDGRCRELFERIRHLCETKS